MDNEEKTLKKWDPILDSMGITGSKADWMTEYTNKQNENLQKNTLSSEGTTSDFPSLLPIAMRVAAKTIGQDLVSVKPMESINHEEMDRIKNEVKAENRERKIDALTENKDFEEMKVEEHPDYKIPGPTGKLFYLDFQYGTASI